MVDEARKKLILKTVAAVAVITLVVVMLLSFLGYKPKTSVTTETKQAHVTITDNGFDPSSLQIEKGTTVVWENASSSPRQVAANPYPDHSSLPALFADTATPPGDLYSFTFSEVGEFGYHDELNPQMNATVTVK